MKNYRIIGGAILSLGFVLFLPDSVNAQEKEKSTDQSSKNDKTAFIDRDGDGIHDGMEHRFRRGKKNRNKRHENRRNGSRNRNQGGGRPNQSSNGP